MFLDKAKIYLKAGRGGAGCVSFRREKYVPFGGPDGGNGGAGGSIYFRTIAGKMNLSDFYRRDRWTADCGQNGKGKNLYGRAGKDLYIDIPAGTVIYEISGGNKKPLKDMHKPGEILPAAKGGRGGRGNLSFKTGFNNAPKISEKGEPGEDKEFLLELKLIADAGIIGLPNAGKSSFLARISSAHPEIAGYPFTTKRPNIGVAYLGEQAYTFVDIPGLIEGAHSGKGMGTDFLRHIERTKFLVHIIDLSGGFTSDPAANYGLIRKELGAYSEKLLDKPEAVVLNKTDLVTVSELKKIRAGIRKKTGRAKDIFEVSLATGAGLKELKEKLALCLKKNINLSEGAFQEEEQFDELREYRAEAGFKIVPSRPEGQEPPAGLVPPGTPAGLKQNENIFIITGKAIERVVEMTYLDRSETLKRFQEYLKKHGIEAALKKQGIRPGDTVRIGKTEFIFQDEKNSN